MLRLVRHLQTGRNRRRGVPGEFGGLDLRDDFFGGADNFLGELAREKKRCFGNTEVRRPALALLHTTQKRIVFRGGKIGIEAGALSWIHRNQHGTNSRRQQSRSRRSHARMLIKLRRCPP